VRAGSRVRFAEVNVVEVNGRFWPIAILSSCNASDAHTQITRELVAYS